MPNHQVCRCRQILKQQNHTPSGKPAPGDTRRHHYFLKIKTEQQKGPTMNKSLLSLTALSLTVAIPALAVDAKLYGSVDKAFVTTDDGRNTDSSVVDNHNNPTRFGLAAEQKLDNGLTASMLLEAGINSNDSIALTQNDTAGQSTSPLGTGTASFTERYARVGLASDKWGALFLGRQDIASDDSFGHDLAAVGELMGPTAFAVFGSGLAFRPQGAGNSLTLAGTTLTPAAMALGNDGSTVFGQGIRYNTPTFYDLNGSISFEQGGNLDLAARGTHKFGMLMVDGGLGYTFVNNNDSLTANPTDGTFATTLSGKLDNGLAGTLGYTRASLGNKGAGIENPNGYYAKLGYNWGDYGVAADYGKFNNPIASATGNKMDAWGLGADYDLGHGVVLGGLYRNYNADVTGTDLKSISTYVANLQVAF
jgi:predicted porin